MTSREVFKRVFQLEMYLDNLIEAYKSFKVDIYRVNVSRLTHGVEVDYCFDHEPRTKSFVLNVTADQEIPEIIKIECLNKYYEYGEFFLGYKLRNIAQHCMLLENNLCSVYETDTSERLFGLELSWMKVVRYLREKIYGLVDPSRVELSNKPHEAMKRLVEDLSR